MKALHSALVLLIVFGACSEKKIASTSTAPAEPKTGTSSESGESAEEAVSGVWAGQIRIDAHEGIAWLNYVGAESGDFVPMRFRTDSEAGKTILAACADEDLCEVEGSVRFLDEPPPENASAIGEIATVTRAKKLPPDAQ